MIGVLAEESERVAITEFFELFKTPWEFYRSGFPYDVVLCTRGASRDGGRYKNLATSARLVVHYAGKGTPLDEEWGIESGQERTDPCTLLYDGQRIPLYGRSVTFSSQERPVLTDEGSGQCVAWVRQSGQAWTARIGYDLFAEVGRLLTLGQPAANAEFPALDLHIAFLRDLITACGLSLVEVPPHPEGHPFVVCLTHDVDHPLISNHRWDHTAFGFLYRATVGSLRKLLRRQLGVRDLLRNWAAAAKLPFVYLGFAKDFWGDFADRYREVEDGLPSTYFLIPFKDRAGRTSDGDAPLFRAAGYGARELAGVIRRLLEEGCEVGLHGIDAWLDRSRGREEFEELRRLTALGEIGVRMHWLYYDENSPALLDEAGAAYDSTVGYNEAVGYRAGTTQAYRPLTSHRMLELPLHAMDTALLNPGRLGMSSRQAKGLLERIVKNAALLGGCLTINWHDRSLAPERLWDALYRTLIGDLKASGAWFTTAGQAASWFQKRRAVVFEGNPAEPGAVRARIAGNHDRRLPRLRLRIYNAREAGEIGTHRGLHYVDVPLNEDGNPLKLPFSQLESAQSAQLSVESILSDTGARSSHE